MEAMVVLTIVAGLTLFSMPKFAALQERSRLTAARNEIEAAFATARAAAVQKGRTSTLTISGNTIKVTVTSDAAGTQTTIIPAMPFDTVFGVTLSATHTVVTFDMRGFASPRLGGTGIYRLVGTSRRDSVCVTTVGQIMTRRCSL